MTMGIGGIFGNPWKRPTIGTGMGDIGMYGNTPPKAKGPGFFSQGGAGRGIAGALGDYLLQASGMRPIYAPYQQEQRAMAYQQKLMEQKRANENADWQGRYDYKLANPEAPKPGSFEWYQTATPEQRALYDQYDPVIAATGAGPVPVSRPSLNFGGNVPTVTNQSEYDAIPSGKQYRDPQGNLRTKR